MKREIVIIGGGPAGLAAAIESARAGAQVLVIDQNDRPGGQLFKQLHKFFGSKAHSAGVRGMDIGTRLLQECADAGVEVWLSSAVIGVYDGNLVAVVRDDGSGQKLVKVCAGRILLATGGMENALNFQGWTLPGVMGAGCAQTMINVNRTLPGKRVLMVGSGNVGLIVGYQLMQAGAELAGIVEAAPKIGGYGVHAAKLRRAGVPFYLNHTIVAAEGERKQVCRAMIGRVDDQWKVIPGSELVLDVDTICIAAGLRPLCKLARMMGLRHVYIPALGGWMPEHDGTMRTSDPNVYVAGDLAGVEEANTAMDEGRLAGLAMAWSLGYLSEESFEAQKGEIRVRLDALRLGPFGQARFEAKSGLMERVMEP